MSWPRVYFSPPLRHPVSPRVGDAGMSGNGPLLLDQHMWVNPPARWNAHDTPASLGKGPPPPPVSASGCSAPAYSPTPSSPACSSLTILISRPHSSSRELPSSPTSLAVSLGSVKSSRALRIPRRGTRRYNHSDDGTALLEQADLTSWSQFRVAGGALPTG
jgi:hypothetical protein